jgi:hypothetical protein
MYIAFPAHLASSLFSTKALLAQSLHSGHTQVIGTTLFAPLLQAVPNPFCGVYNLVLPWAGGAALLGLLLAVLGFFLRNLAPTASVQLENGLKGVGIGLFLMGLILQPNFLNAVAAALGASGMNFNCPANP